jgi:catechol 2,3-dioxygenase-like lactoylglutathione lyase family enzyme
VPGHRRNPWRPARRTCAGPPPTGTDPRKPCARGARPAPRYAPPVLTRIDHVQLAMPVGGEPTARRFFVDVMGMTEVPKPAALAVRGGCWFRAGEVELHLGIEPDFRPAKKAHPALRVADLEGVIARLREAGVTVRDDDELPGVRRCFIDDPFGNRIELIADRV